MLRTSSIGARIVRHGRYVVSQAGSQLAVRRGLFGEIRQRIDGLRL
jgi:hypothetical protein